MTQLSSSSSSCVIHGDSYRCHLTTNEEVGTLMMTYAPTGITGFKAKADRYVLLNVLTSPEQSMTQPVIPMNR